MLILQIQSQTEASWEAPEASQSEFLGSIYIFCFLSEVKQSQTLLRPAEVQTQPSNCHHSNSKTVNKTLNISQFLMARLKRDVKKYDIYLDILCKYK